MAGTLPEKQQAPGLPAERSALQMILSTHEMYLRHMRAVSGCQPACRQAGFQFKRVIGAN